MAENSLVKAEKKAEVTTPEFTRGAVTFTPRVDIIETPEELLLYADVPGVKQEDVDVRFESGELILHGKCNPRHPAANQLLNEFEFGDFYRVFTLNESIDAEKIAAELKQGVLTVHLPKSEAVKPRKITVKGQ
jgi:HSP20 family molecular chaperone IbpA